jgi:predicted DNA-binding transcriptional regulator YafY
MPSTISPLTTSLKGEKLAQRLTLILALLHQGDAIDKHELAQRFGVDLRTIERDLGERLRGIAERNGDGRWQLAQAARSTIPARHLHGYAQLVGTAHVFPDTSLRYLLEELETPEPHRAVRVQPTPHEDLREYGPDFAHFARLQAAIEQRHECRFTYKGKPRHAQPYRLIHKNGVWYLAAEEAARLKNFSVALIEGLQVDDADRFTPKPAHQHYIDGKDDIWFTEASTEVLLRVAPSITHYFTRRALLPQQQQRLDDDGTLLVTAQINHVNQLLPVVRYWLPHVRIISPTNWQQDLEAQLRDYLNQSTA